MSYRDCHGNYTFFIEYESQLMLLASYMLSEWGIIFLHSFHTEPVLAAPRLRIFPLYALALGTDLFFSVLEMRSFYGDIFAIQINNVIE